MKVNQLIPVKRAFTLVEMLVVVSIIGVLVVMSFPAFKKAMASSKRSTCMSYERQIASGLFAYAADHENRLPPVDAGYPNTANDANHWNYMVWTYCGYAESDYTYPTNDTCTRKGLNVTRKNIFRCPEIWGNPPCPPGVQINPNRMSYALNSGVGIPSWQGAWTTPVPLASVSNPAATAMIVEASFLLGTCSGYRTYWGLIPHDEGLNVLFYDGHVQYMKFKDIPSQNTDLFWSGQ